MKPSHFISSEIVIELLPNQKLGKKFWETVSKLSCSGTVENHNIEKKLWDFDEEKLYIPVLQRCIFKFTDNLNAEKCLSLANFFNALSKSLSKNENSK